MTNFVKTDTGTLQLSFTDISGTLGLGAFAGTQTNGFTLQIVSGVATWSSVSATNATNLSSGAAGEIPYQSAANTTLFTAAGTTGQPLLSGGTGSPTWSSTIIVTLQSALQNGGTLGTGTTTISWTAGDVIEYTMGSSSATLAFSNTPPSNTIQTITIVLIQPASGGPYTIPAFSSTIKWDSGAIPVLATGASKTDIIQITAINVSGTTTYYGAQIFGNG
jgi:hypothetical protein